MRPGLPTSKFTRRQPEVRLGPVGHASGGGDIDQSKKPLALPPIPEKADAAKPASSPTATRQPVGLRDAVRQPDGSLVPALNLSAVGPAAPPPGTLQPAASAAVASRRSGNGKALTARKPTDSDAGRLATKLLTIERSRAAAGGPVSQFPVHGGAVSVRNPAASCARPPLAIELEAFLRREVNMLVRHGPGGDALAKVSIAKEGFGCFITHFPEYAGPLELIKGLYDGAVDSGFALRQQRHVLETENIGFREYHTTVLEKEKAESRQAAVDAESTMRRLQTLLDAQQARQQELELELHRMTNTLTERNQQLDEAESRAALFEKSVIELTDKGVAVQQRLTAARRDNERLHHTISTLEQQVREAEAGVSDTMGMSMSRRRKSRAVSMLPAPSGTVGTVGTVPSPPQGPAPVKSGQTIGSTVGITSAMRNVVKEAVLGESVKTTSFAQDTAAGSPGIAGLDSPAGAFGGGGDADDDDDYDMPLPGEDTREAVLELETRLKRVTRQNYLLTTEREALLQRLESLQANLEREKNDMTPRPPWPTAQEILPGFGINALATSEETLADLIQFFKDELAEEKREAEKKALSKTVRDWLGQEDLCEGDLVGKHRYFVCKGTGGHVPVYLRAAGVVRNRKIRKGDVEKLLSKLWTDRRLALRIETNLNATPIGEYFHEWLVGVTGSTKAAVELAYNMLAVCEQYQQDPDCGMFIRILRGELCEHAMFEQADLLENLNEVMRANDPRKKRHLSRFTIHRIMNKFFPVKTRQDMLRLRFSLMASCKGATMVDYEALFAEDEEGNQSRFVELIRRQHVEEATSFTVAVEEALREAIRDDGKLDLNNARMSLKHLDPAMPNTRIEDVMAFGCGMTLTEMERYGQFFAVEAEPFLERVRRGVLLHRYSRASADTEEDGGSGDEDEGELFANDDLAERERAREEGMADADADIIIPENRRQTGLFSEGTRVEAGGTTTVVPEGSPPSKKKVAVQSPKVPGSPASPLDGSAKDGSASSSSAPPPSTPQKKLMTAAEKKEDFKFLDAFTKPAEERRRRGSLRRASILASLDEPPAGEGASTRGRRKSLAEALTDGDTIDASAAFAAVSHAMDQTS